jgi:hypothetical protein
VLGISANNINPAKSFDNFTILTDGFYAGSYFHLIILMLRIIIRIIRIVFWGIRMEFVVFELYLSEPSDDSASGQIVGRHFYNHLIARQNSD